MSTTRVTYKLRCFCDSISDCQQLLSKALKTGLVQYNPKTNEDKKLLYFEGDFQGVHPESIKILKNLKDTDGKNLKFNLMICLTSMDDMGGIEVEDQIQILISQLTPELEIHFNFIG